jgi:hypothetical protein
MHAARMFSRVRNYFQGSKLARMSSGHYCMIRDLGLVKGGKGLKHHEVVLELTFRGLIRFLREGLKEAVSSADRTERQGPEASF